MTDMIAGVLAWVHFAAATALVVQCLIAERQVNSQGARRALNMVLAAAAGMLAARLVDSAALLEESARLVWWRTMMTLMLLPLWLLVRELSTRERR